MKQANHCILRRVYLLWKIFDDKLKLFCNKIDIKNLFKVSRTFIKKYQISNINFHNLAAETLI